MLIHSPKELAIFVIRQRKKLKLSQAEVAKRIGVKQQTISDFETNPTGTKLKTLFRILSAVNLDIWSIAKDETLNSKEKWREEW